MDRKRIAYITIGFGVLLVVLMLMLTWGGHRRTGGIVLPEHLSDAGGPGDDSQNSRLNPVTITPETAASAIGVLARPTAYSRTQTVETFWSGGSGQTVTQVYVSGSRTRLDTALPDGSVRHTLLAAGEDGTAAGIWYDDEPEWTAVSSRSLNADLAGRMLTYETVRDLAPEDIAAADYRDALGEYCIYVETQPDGDGYSDRYWISVGNGLLAGAERYLEDRLVYRFSAGEPDISPQEDSLFLLPDGSELDAAAVKEDP